MTTGQKNKKSIKHRVFEIVEVAKTGDELSKLFDMVINFLIIATTIGLYAVTFKELLRQLNKLFEWFFIISSAIFLVEYIFKLWTADIAYPKKTRFKARIAYATSMYGIIDFIALLPFLFPSTITKGLAILRIFRLLRLFRLKRFKRLDDTFRLFERVFTKKREELAMTISIVIVLILVVALFMYYAENRAQPEVFTNVFDAIWWATITLTTVGYGDMYPITALGRLLGMIIAILGIGFIALPTSILGSAMMEEIESQKSGKKKNEKCLHCGKDLHTS